LAGAAFLNNKSWEIFDFGLDMQKKEGVI